MQQAEKMQKRWYVRTTFSFTAITVVIFIHNRSRASTMKVLINEHPIPSNLTGQSE
jgi:hypothetical protein